MSYEAQVHEAGAPKVADLLRNYEETLAELDHYIDQCEVSYDTRRNNWAGKRRDLRKAGADAVPWDGASDSESMVVAERVSAFVSLCMFALSRAHIRAYPVEAGDVSRSRLVSSFLKWMRDSYIPDFARQMELSANYLFEKGLSITYVGWERRQVTREQIFDIEQIAEQAPEFAEMLMDQNNDEQIVALLQTQFPKLKTARAKRALKTLRKDGVATLTVSVRGIDRPVVQALAPDTDVFFPHYCVDPQKAPYVHRRVLMTPQELWAKVDTDDWDKAWVKHVIEQLRGEGTTNIDAKDHASTANNPGGRFQESENDFVEILYTYQRLIADDGAEGIYCTVWHRNHTANNAHAKYELQNGLDDYPFIVTEMERSTKRMYDVTSMVDLLRGCQWNVKAMRDARIDRASIATLPPSRGPVGRPKPELRPGGHITERRAGEYSWMDPPPGDAGSIEIESTLLAQADRLVGLANPEQDPESSIKKAYYINKFLKHVRDVLLQSYKAFQRYGPEELLFRVSGTPEAQKFEKGDPNQEMDISVHFDSQMSDPETVEKKLAQMLQLLQYDRTGKIDVEAMLEAAAAAIDPVLADIVLQPQEQGTAKIARDVAEDLSMIYAGLEMGARPQGAQIAMQIAQNYMKVPDVAARLQDDEAFSERLTKYFGQYQFQLQQNQNAEIGKLGTEPADFQGVQQG